MIPFKFSSTVAYMIEADNLSMRFFFDGALLSGDGAPIVTPFLEADLPQLQFRQVGDVIWITHLNYKQYKLSRTTTTTFSLDAIIFTKGPFKTRNDIAEDDDVTMKYTGTLTAGSTGTLISSSAHFEAGHVDALFELTHPRILSDATTKQTGEGTSSALDIKGNWSFNTHGTWTGDATILRNENGNGDEVFRTFNSDNDRNIQFSSTEKAFNTKYSIRAEAGMSDGFSADLTANTSTTEGIVRIDSITSPTQAAVTVLSLIGGTSADTTKRWAEGSWSDVQGFPKSTTFFGNRVVYAGGQDVWLSEVGGYEDFEAGLNDNDSFSVFISTGNEIMWVNTVAKTIAIGTSGAPWTLQTNKVGTVLTPNNFTIDEQAGQGSADIQAVKVDDALIFISRNGKKILEYAWGPQPQKYVSTEITVLAEHFTDTSTITWLTYQRRPESIIWFGMADGTMHSFSYQRDQNVLAYAPHPTDGTVNSGAVIPGLLEDEVWLSVERALDAGTIAAIERMTQRTITTNEDVHHVDSGIIYDDVPTTTITGLDHLDGEVCDIWADGVNVGPATPAGGSITLAVAASVVHVGLPYIPFLKPMRLDIDTSGGSSHGSTKHIDELVVSVLNSIDTTIGDNTTDQLGLFNIDDPELVNNTDIDGLFTGDADISGAAGYSVDDPILISCVGAAPLTVRAIVARLNQSGR
jgi:hypothetical protein